MFRLTRIDGLSNGECAACGADWPMPLDNAESRAAQLFEDCEFKQGQIEARDSRIRQLEAERDEARKQLEQAQKQIAELEAMLKDIATAPYENQPNDGNELEKEYYLRGMHH